MDKMDVKSSLSILQAHCKQSWAGAGEFQPDAAKFSAL